MSMKILLESWNNYLTEGRDFPSLISTLTAQRRQVYTVTMMTAENPNAQKTSPKKNAEYNEKLEKTLRSMNVGYRKIRGRFGNYEHSYFIPNISKRESIMLGRMFNQEAVIWGVKRDDRFIFEYIECESGATTNVRDVVLVNSDIQSKEDYYSQSNKGPEKFVIPFFDDEYEMDAVDEYNMPSSGDNPLSEEINKRIKMTLEENRTEKSVWYNRGVIKELYKKTRS